MIIIYFILLLITYFCLLYSINTKFLINTVTAALNQAEKKKSVSRLSVFIHEIIFIFFELVFIALLLLILYIELYLPVIWAYIISFLITFIFVELLLKLLVKISYQAQNESEFVKKSKTSKFIKLLFKLSFILLPNDLKKLVGENQLFIPFCNAPEKKRMHLNEDEGVAEQEIIDRVFELGDQSVYEVMRPRTEIAGVDITASISEVHNKFVTTGYSKLIVYDENVDNIKGVVFAYDLFKSPKDLLSILREVIFVPENKKSIETLNLFLNNRISIAVVVDEFGGTAGIVTMEDIIEELFGEIKDEYDVDENICRRLSPQSYIFSGKVEIDYINETFDLDIPYGEYETIGGLIITHSGRIPHKGEIVKIDRFIFTIIRGTNIKIDLVKMIISAKHTEK